MAMADGHLTEEPGSGFTAFSSFCPQTRRSYASVGERTACLYGPVCMWTWINFQSQNASSVS